MAVECVRRRPFHLSVLSSKDHQPVNYFTKLYHPPENYFTAKKRSISLVNARANAREAKVALQTFGYNAYEIIDMEGDWEGLITQHMLHVGTLAKLNNALADISFNVDRFYYSKGLDFDAKENLIKALQGFNRICKSNINIKNIALLPKRAQEYKRSLDKAFRIFLNFTEDKYLALKEATGYLVDARDDELSRQEIKIRDLKYYYNIVVECDREVEEFFFTNLSDLTAEKLYFFTPNRKRPTTLFPFSPLLRHPKRNRQAELDKKRTRQTSFDLNGSQIPSVEKSRLKVIEQLLQKQNSLNSYIRIFSKVLEKFKNFEIDETTNQEELEVIKNELANCLKKFNSTSFSKVLEKFDEKNHRLEGKLNILFRETTKFLRQIEDMAPDSMRNTFKVKILRVNNIDREINRIFHNYLSLMNSTDIAKLDRLYQKTLLELKKRNALEEEYGILADSERSSEEEYEVLAGSERSSENSYELV